MVDYREILRLASEPRNSQRQIAASVGSSHHTVKEVVETARLKGIEGPLEETVSNEMLMSILFPDKYESSSCFLEPDYEYIHKELAKPGVTMTLLWNEYRSNVRSAERDRTCPPSLETSIADGRESPRQPCAFITSPAMLWKWIGRVTPCRFTIP